MKKAKLILSGLLLLAMIFAGIDVQSQGINLGVTRTGLNPGDTIMVPLRLTGTGVASAAVFFNYDQSVLSPQANVYSQAYFPSGVGGIFSDYNPYYGTNIYYYAFFTGNGSAIPPMTNRLFGYFCFIYTGGTSGTTTIHLRKSPDPFPVCGFWNVVGTEITIATYSSDISISGSTGISSTVLYSLPSAGTIDWDYPDSWSTTPAGPPGDVLTPAACFNVVIQGDEVQVNGTAIGTAKCNNVTINPGGKLTVNEDLPNLIDGELAIGGNLIIQGNAGSTGSFIDFGPTTVAGTTTIQRVMDGNWIPGNTLYKSHLISSPVAGQSNNIFDGSLMNRWDEPTQNWNPLSLPYITMGVGVGYAVSPLNPGITATFSGVVNTGNKSVNFTNTGAGTFTGYNLIGNPYPSAINWDANFTTPGTLNPTAWVWNDAGSYIAIHKTSSPGAIGAEQGFFVQATGAGTITFTNAVRAHNPVFYKSTVSDLLTLKVEGNNYWDQTQVHINSLASAGYEAEFDAAKLIGSTDAPQIYSMIPDHQLSINTLSELNGSSVIQFGFQPGSVNNFTITASGIESFTPSTEFYLEDLIANKIQNLKVNPVYTFSAAPGQDKHRFNMHFSPVGIQDAKAATGIKIYSSGKTIYVNIQSEMKGSIVVYNLLGIEIARKDIQSLSMNKINLDVPTGFYLVKVDGDSNTSTGKVFIK
ncbi:MAG: T9SS type A sorting domain-containing protein [Bacteroidales bacterium]|nr:T9SS type A sorting domain-containing protein [Bacteroidales bacterium]